MKLGRYYFLVLLVGLLTACNLTKFVPDGEYLLYKTEIKTDSKEIPVGTFKKYLRQTPNAKALWFFRPQLGIYNLAGRDSTKWLNKLLKRIGDEPVIYSPSLTSLSVQQLQRALENKGYVNAKVESSLITKNKKAQVEYHLNFNKPYTVRNYNLSLDNIRLSEIAQDSSRSLIHPQMLFDVDVLNAERDRISKRFRQQGYYKFNKDFLAYTADSMLNSHKVDVTMELRDYLKQSSDSIKSSVFTQYTIRKVIFYTNSETTTPIDVENNQSMDTVRFRDFYLVSPHKGIVKLDALVQNTYINPQSLYSDRAVEKTYSALNSLDFTKYVSINFKEINGNQLDCYIDITPSKAFTLSTEAEGTYTNGYWGVGGNLNTTHRNIFGGAETLSLQARMALEWQNDVVAEEWGGQAGLKFPKFLFPIGGYEFKRNIHANTEFTTLVSYQYRPAEFKTTNIGAGITYSWTSQRYRHNFQALDLNYVHFPWISDEFTNRFLSVNPPIFNPYNYRDHFIIRIGYNGSFSTANSARPLQNFVSARYNIESAGNLLYGINQLFGSRTFGDGSYQFLGVRYAQYVKGECNITYHQIFDGNNRIVYRAGLGLGVPYGNADAIPYEKRFFSGGANSVRGWSESTLGPGTYHRVTNKARDYNQVGDIKLDLNMEYRVKLIWVAEGALFIDAGNIWTIKNYETQEGGTFKFNTFAQQIALAYGLGFRFDFSFIIFRMDFGLKLFDPALDADRWRITPRSQDLAIHIGIGYPF